MTASNRFPRIQGIRVDLDAIARLRHACSPRNCRHRTSCCAHYDVAITEDELERVIGCLPEVEALAPDVAVSDLYEENDDGSIVLDTDDDGCCVLAYRDQEGGMLCSLHTIALRHGIAPEQTKPLCCCLWPLALSEGRAPVLSVQDDALSFPCNQWRSPSAPGLDPGVAAILTACFGAAFQTAVEARL